nr:hypothetical protein Iba_chr07dCG3530 [Ipomoea batatas]
MGPTISAKSPSLHGDLHFFLSPFSLIQLISLFLSFVPSPTIGEGLRSQDEGGGRQVVMAASSLVRSERRKEQLWLPPSSSRTKVEVAMTSSPFIHNRRRW